MKRRLVLVGLMAFLLLAAAACQQQAPQTVEKLVTQVVEVPVEVEKVITQVVEVTTIVEGTPQVETIIITATPEPEPEATEAPEAPPAPEPGAGQGTYRVGMFSDISTTNYWNYLGPGATVYNAYVLLPQRLTLYGLAARTFQFVPNLAHPDADPAVQEQDGQWVSEIQIVEGVTWSDGTPLTANDIAFTANTALELELPGNWASAYDPNYLESVEAVDDTTVRFIYHTQPGLAVHEYGTLTAPILSEAYWGDVVEEARAAVAEVGEKPAEDASEEELTAYEEAKAEALNVLFGHEPENEPVAGPYLATNWEPGAFAENPANPDYHFAGTETTQYANEAYQEVRPDGTEVCLYGDCTGDAAAQWTEGPFVESTIYSVYGDQTAAILALKNGEIDYVLNSLGLQRGLAEQVQGDPNLTVIENPTFGFRYLGFNVREAPMNDKAFRQAVATLIDREFVAETILQGVADPAYTVVPPGNVFWYNPDVPRYGFTEGDDGELAPMTRQERLSETIRILTEAGYSWEGDALPTFDPVGNSIIPGGALLLPDGSPMPEIELAAPSAGYDPLRSTYAIWIETWLNEVGIPVRANLQGFNVLVPKIFDEQDIDMWILGWSTTVFPDYLRDFFHSEQAVPGGNNAGGFSALDAELDAIKTCTSFEECQELAFTLQERIAEELPYVVLFDTPMIEAYRSAAVTYPFTETPGGLQFVQGLPTTVIVSE